MPPKNFQELSNFIWSVADLLRGPYRPPQYERVMLPLMVLRRFDCVLEPTKAKVLKRYEQIKEGKNKNLDPILNTVAGGGVDLGFHNHSPLDFPKLKGDPDNIGRHLTDYIAGFSENVRKIFERFEFEKEIEKLEEANRLYAVVSKFAEIDLHPGYVDNITMGLIFEDLIRRFNEAANETAGDHFTPREVIRLMVNLLLEPDEHILTTDSFIARICDPACGTGGMLSEAQNWIREHNDTARVIAFGQDYNPRSYAVAASDLLIKGHRDSRVEFGNTLTDDRFSGESDIRRWIIGRDMLEAIVALPEQMFYNTGIGTYIWVVTNRKERKRRGKIQLIDARERWSPMRRSLGDKRRYLPDEVIAQLTKEHGKFGETDTSRIFDNADFGYRRITIERPKRDKADAVLTDKKGEPLADADLRDFENVPMKEDVRVFFEREVRPFVSDAWINETATDEQDRGIGKVGYEINFNRVFFKYEEPRPLKIIDAELAAVEKRILGLLREVTE